MRLYFHFCAYGFNNSYILGAENPGLPPGPSNPAARKEAILIDPGEINEHIIKRIEENEYVLRGVFFTHGHLNHSHGVTTLKKIYDTDIYCVSPEVQDHKTIPVKDGEIITLGAFRIEVITVPGHSADSAVFKIGHLLFTGDALSAGLVGSTANVYAAANQMTALRNKIFSIPGHYAILPGHGPPTTLEAEKRFNAGMKAYKDNKPRHPRFKLEFD